MPVLDISTAINLPTSHCRRLGEMVAPALPSSESGDVQEAHDREHKAAMHYGISTSSVEKNTRWYE
jgi:hypothetical protein